MVANTVIPDYRYNFVYCFTDAAIPAGSTITLSNTSPITTTAYTVANGWSPSSGSINQGVIGFSYRPNTFVFGDSFTLNFTNGTEVVSAYAGVTSDLLLSLDASQRPSYPGSGTSWFDISKSGPRTCTLTNGPTFTTANNGAIVFDGVDDYVACGNLGSFPINGTISFWMNSTAVENYRNPFSTAYLAGNACIRFEQYTTVSPYGGFNVAVGNDAGNFQSYDYSPTAVLTPNTWYNFVLAWSTSSSALSGYMNGVNKFKTNSQVNWPGALPSVTLGSGYDAGRYFKGSISNVQIYNRALTAPEVFQNYNFTIARLGLGNSVIANGLLAYFNSGDTNSYSGSGSTWFDLSNNGNSATVSGSPTFSNGVFTFNGVDQFFFINTSSGFFNYNTNSFYADVGYAWSVTVWFKFPVAPTSVRDATVNGGNCSYCILGKSGGIGGAETISLFVSANNSNTSAGALNPYLLLLGLRGAKTQISPGSVNTNTWNHVAITWSGTSGTMYFNGAYRGLLNVGTAGIQTATYLNVGSTANAPSAHGFEGSISQVKIYNRQLTNAEIIQDFNNGKTQFGQSDPIVTDGITLYLDAGDYKSYPKSGTTWTDLSIYANNGTLTNGPTFNSANGGAIVFDGVDDYVDCGNSLSSYFSSQSVTVFANAKISSIVSKNNLISFNGVYNFFLPGNRLTTTYQLYWDSASGWKNGNKSDWNVGQIYCLAWTISGTTLTFYVNGVVDGSTTLATSFAPSQQTRIGLANGGELATGSIYNVLVYNRALSQQEITQNFNATKSRYGY